jgi:hypothetical protein
MPISKKSKFFLIIALLFVTLYVIYNDEVALFVYLVGEKYKYNEDDYPEVYVVPNDDIVDISGTYCKAVDGSAQTSLFFGSLELLVSISNNNEIDIDSDSEKLLIQYKNGQEFVVFASAIDSDMLAPGELGVALKNGAEDARFTGPFSATHEYTKLEVVNYILSSTPDSASYMNGMMSFVYGVIALKIKQGLVPKGVKYMYKVFVSNNVSAYLIGSIQDDSVAHIVYLYNDISESLYQLNFINYSQDQVKCILSGIKSSKA